MIKHILLVGGMRVIHDYLIEEDVKVTLIHEIKKIKGKDTSKYNRIIGVENDSDAKEWVTLAKAIHQLDPFTDIGGYAELYQEKAAMIAQELKLDYYSPELINNITNKYNMRTKLKSTQSEDVRFENIKSPEEVEVFMDKVGGPVILKPLDSWASVGVSLITEKSQIKEALNITKSAAGVNDVLVEEYISGEEFSVEVFSHRGLHSLISITKKYKDEISFVEQGHVVSYEKQLGIKSISIESKVFSYLDALEVTNGPSHTEIIIENNNDIKIIETHLRAGGDFIPELIKWSGGVDLLKLSAYQTLNKEKFIVEENYEELKEVHAIWFVFPTEEGIIKEFTGLDEVRNLTEVVKVEELKSVGDEVVSLKSSFDRLAYVIAKGEDSEEAIENARKYANNIKVILE